MTHYDKLPRRVWVGNYEFRIRVVPRATDRLAPEKDGDQENDGITIFEPTEIMVAADMAAPLLLEVVWHEITHAINWDNDVDDGADEETICDRHGKAWTAFWVANPRFARWWNGQVVAIRKERERG